MKNLFLSFVALCFMNSMTFSQSYFTQQQSVRFYKSNKRAAPNSVWFGGQATYQISRKSEFADNIVPNASGFWEITTLTLFKKDLVIPSVFNIGMMRSITSEYETKQKEITANLQQIANTSQGINIGFNPYYKILEKEKGFSITLHGLASAKINAFKLDTISTNYLLQGRFSIGADITIGEIWPATLSFAPVYSIFDSKSYREIFGEEKSYLLTYETSIILPIGTGVAGVISFDFGKHTDFAWRFGIILATQ